jgi:hypothetical protein
VSYILFICAAISWAGCGRVDEIPMPDRETCFAHLREIRTDNHSGARQRSMYAVCKPAGGSSGR